MDNWLTGKNIVALSFACAGDFLLIITFLVALCRRHGFMDVLTYRVQVYDSVTHHLCIVLRVHHPKSGLLPSPFIPLSPLLPHLEIIFASQF